MTLAEIFGTVKGVCYKDDKGVYLNGEMVALDNSHSNGYIRRDGARSLDRIGGCTGDYNSQLPLKFVGAYPGGNVDLLERATIAALTSDQREITEVETDKGLIAESEGIPLEELTKFDGVALVMVSYIESGHYVADPKCDYSLC